MPLLLYFILFIFLINPTYAQKRDLGIEGHNDRVRQSYRPPVEQSLGYFQSYGFGVGLQVAPPIYSIDLPTLHTEGVGGGMFMGYGVMGARINNRHDAAIRIAITGTKNGFNYKDAQGEGLTLNKHIMCILYQVHYGYNVSPIPELWISPYLNIGGGTSFPFGESGVEQSMRYQTAQGEVHHYYYTNVPFSERGLPIDIMLGAGVRVDYALFNDETWKVGLDIGWVGSLRPVYTNGITYIEDRDNTVQDYNFETQSYLSNFQIGLHITHVKQVY